jgi:hypothetical protein
MIKVTFTVHPSGNEDPILAESKGEIIITNDGSGTLNIGNYNYRITKFDGTGAWRKGRVENFRRISRGPWDLLYLVLKNAVADRNGG